ncbi:MAG TPA: hypothetical protein EYQ85_06030 [Candidatus Poseidoniales archaeon]|nr:hypothetical protein [Candidatus Poseidoniales archaeon]
MTRTDSNRGKLLLPSFLVLLMLTSTASAGISVWVGPTTLSGQNQNISTVWEIPGNATVLDAWLNINEDGMTGYGNGSGWHGMDLPGNFTAGQSTGTTMDHFTNYLSLEPNQSVSQIEQFGGASFQLPFGWTDNTGVWGIGPLTNITGSVSGPTRTVPYGQIPAQPYSGSLSAATMAGSALPANTDSSLETPGSTLPAPISNFSFSFQHWYHLNTSSNTNGDGDGAWMEYKLDNGNWTWIEPQGGYPNTISSSAPVPTGAVQNGSHGFPVFASLNASGWDFANFTLDNISGISTANQIYFRFRVWTQAFGTQRPGWFIDDIDFTNIGNSSGVWHNGCYNSNGQTCGYSNNADGILEFPVIDLSSANNTLTVSFRADWDLEGSAYDNWWLEASTDNSTWLDVTTSNTQFVTTGWNTPDGIPTDGVIIGGTTYNDDSGGWVNMNLDLPASFIGDATTWIRYRVETDGSITYGNSPDSREGLTLDDIRIHESNSTFYFWESFNSSFTVTHSGLNNLADDWQYLLLGMGGVTFQYGFEDAPALPPGGWQVVNIQGQTGWEFGTLGSTGPSSWSSPNTGFGTVLNGAYDPSSWNHFYTPTYTIPAGASSRFIFDQWICAEYGWDGGAIYISVNNGTWNHFDPSTNNNNWYDTTIQFNTNSPLNGLGVFDGNIGSTNSCTQTSLGWRTTKGDLSNYSGNDVAFRFSFTADTAVQYDGWYVDDVGLEVDWFDTTGEWLSPLIPPGELGLGFIDIDAKIPNGTWISGSLVDTMGNVIAGFENDTFPMSLSELDIDTHAAGVSFRLNMGTNNPILTPLVSSVHIGSKRMMNGIGAQENGWTIPSGMTINSTGVLVNTGGGTQTITSDFVISSQPLDGYALVADASGITVSVIDIDGVGYGMMSAPTATAAMNDAHPGFGVEILVSPGGWINSLSLTGQMVTPALDPAIDIAMDGTIDWKFPSSPFYGSMGWQNRIAGSGLNNAMPVHAESITVAMGSSTSIALPADAIITAGLISVAPDGSIGDSVSIEVAGSPLQSLSNGWQAQSLVFDSAIRNSIHSLTSSHTDSNGRDWVEVEIGFSGTSQDLTIPSVIIGYRLFENITGLAPVVKTHHEANNDGGSKDIVDIPLVFTSGAGGITIDGGVYHELMITNEPFSVPSTFHPDGTLQNFTSGHHHLYDQTEIAEVKLIGTTSAGDQISCTASSLGNGGVFTQTSGSDMMQLNTTASSVSLISGSWQVDWQFEILWDWDDEAKVEWSAQAFNHTGEGLAPAIAISGGSGSQASENDLEIDTWLIFDQFGNELSNSFDSSYPFPAMATSMLNVSGTVRFQNTIETRPQVDDFIVSVNVSGIDIVMNSTAAGIWSGQIQVPSLGEMANIIPQIVRVGPIIGAAGAQDESLLSPHSAIIDSQAPQLTSLKVDTTNGLKIADGFTWDPSQQLKVWAAFNESIAYSDSMTLHYWREGMDLPGVYQSIDASMPDLSKGEWTVSFDNIDLSQVPTNGNVSLYLSGNDWAGNPLAGGGDTGMERDAATLVVATNVDPQLDTTQLSLDRFDEYLLPGREHTFSMQINEPNGLHTLDLIELRLAGSEEETLAVVRIDPRSNSLSTPADSLLEVGNITIMDVGEGVYLIQVSFTLSWELSPDSLPDWALPSVMVFDDDLVNPVITVPNLGQLRWQLDSGLMAETILMEDLTPPISPSSEDELYVGLGDEVKLSGNVIHAKSGEVTSKLPQDVSLTIEYEHGSQPRMITTEVSTEGLWSTAFVLDNRRVDDPRLSMALALHGLPGQSFDLTDEIFHVIIDSTAPSLLFEGLPVTLDSTYLLDQSFIVSVNDAGGMSGDDLTLWWEFRRPSAGGDSSSLLPAPFHTSLSLSEAAGEFWKYSANVDLTNGSILGLLPGDLIFIWVEAYDQAGNSALGVGTEDDKLSPHLNVRQFVLSLPSLNIALADGSTPRGGEVSEGDELGISVSIRNLGSKTGHLRVELFQETGQGNAWVSQGFRTIDIMEGQLRTLEPFIFETYASGGQSLHINITGDFDDWDSRSSPPGCILRQQVITCDLSLEQDMPAVLSRDLSDGEGLDVLTITAMFVLILVIVLLVVVVMKKQGNSIYDDEEWEDVSDDVTETMTYDAPYAVEEAKSLAPLPEANEETPVNTGPPLPESGLPEGWSDEQWIHYGEQWLEKNQ